jgi:hypothetical protein
MKIDTLRKSFKCKAGEKVRKWQTVKLRIKKDK